MLVVFGGENAAGGALGDTWEWNPITNAWTQILFTNPTARKFSAMAWDPTGTSDLVLFGGLDGSGTHLNDTWVYFGGAGWVQLTPTTSPSTRRQHSMMSRADHNDVLMCAGQEATLPAPTKWRTDVWTWNGLDWTLIPTTNTPAAVVANQAVYDPNRQKVVMVGGNGINGGAPTSQLSEFDTVTNDWTVYGYATPGTNDPVIGRISRYFAAFLPSTGYIYKVLGQVPFGGASPTTTCRYGNGLPPSYPGNGADVAIEVSLNGAVSGGIADVHTVDPADLMGFRFFSPNTTLETEELVVGIDVFSTGSPFFGLSLLPGDPANIWLNPASATVIPERLQPGGLPAHAGSRRLQLRTVPGPGQPRRHRHVGHDAGHRRRAGLQPGELRPLGRRGVAARLISCRDTILGS